MPQRRRICFVTGSRAEFGLMESTLRAIKSHPNLEIQIVATGSHLEVGWGTLRTMRRAGFELTTIRWFTNSDRSPSATASATGRVIMRLAKTFQKLNPDVVLVVGDRVEAFAAAAAAHISQIPLAHVHGGDRALGQIDDSLRHAISKLAHIHFPATRESGRRLRRLGEDTFRVFTVGSPGIDGINDDAAPLEECITAIQMSPLRFKEDPRVPLKKHRYALFLFHPVSADDLAEQKQVSEIFARITSLPYEHVITIDSNTDPGSSGIRQWSAIEWLENPEPTRRIFVDNIPRQAFLGLLRDAAVLIGNSSSGIIEAASFGTPVINIGDRQKGRERNKNVIDVPANAAAIRRALKKVWNNGRPIRFPRKNIYGSGRTSEKIAQILATNPLDERLRRKLITY